MLDVHYIGTANGLKLAIMLAETGLPYTIRTYEMFTGEHLTAEFRRMNPNNKLPVIVDNDPADGGPPLPVFETGAILTYLAEKTGMLMPTDFRRRALAQQWLTWQVAGQGPMNGQAHHFVRYAPEGQDYGVQRYTREAERLLHVLEYRLEQADYLAEEYSIADIACFPWVQGSPMIGIGLDQFPAITAWSQRIFSRPQVAAAIANPEFAVPQHYLQGRARLTEEEWSAMFGDRLHAVARAR